ncbi:MAG TPA: hypothetical protein VHC72_01020 [Bryobacteraceae bacterium]|nr:hypothetical protein [Bryobacteraceae bacterium]
MRLLLLAFVASAAHAACLPVAGDRILASDLARADARFAALPGDLPLAFTPHVFHLAELQRIARANGLALESLSEVCFEMQLHAPDEADFLEAMRRSLPPSAVITMVEMFPSPVPAGTIVFPASTRSPQMWRGYVQYAPTRRFPIWARVSVSMTFVARRGDTVPVEVHSGRAVIRFDAVAQKDIFPDGIADLRNPATGRTFHARMDGTKAVLVVGKGPA